MRKAQWLMLAVFLGPCGLWCGVEIWQWQLGVQKAEALFQGNPGMRLKSVEIEFQQRRVLCSDPTALRYFEQCLSAGAKHDFDEGGVTYRLRLRFVGGGQVGTQTFWLKDGFCLFLPYQETDAGVRPKVSVAFSPPVPTAFTEIVDFLNRPYQEVKGVVLILESGGIRREFDRSLVFP